MRGVSSTKCVHGVFSRECVHGVFGRKCVHGVFSRECVHTVFIRECVHAVFRTVCTVYSKCVHIFHTKYVIQGAGINPMRRMSVRAVQPTSPQQAHGMQHCEYQIGRYLLSKEKKTIHGAQWPCKRLGKEKYSGRSPALEWTKIGQYRLRGF